MQDTKRSYPVKGPAIGGGGFRGTDGGVNREVVTVENIAPASSDAGPLVIYAKFASNPPPTTPPVPSPATRSVAVRVAQAVSSGEVGRRQSRREERYALRNGILRAVTSKHRVAACGRCRIDADQPVGLSRKQQADGEGAAAFSNLQSCGSVWLCPVCATKVRTGRAVEIERAVAGHLAGGGGLLVGALTVPHQRFDDLARVLDVVKGSFRKAVSGGAWKKDREEFGVIGFIRAVEITHGNNGWHPHLHLLIFTERLLEPLERKALNERIFTRFARFVEREGLGKPLATYNRLEAVKNAQAVSRYISKAVLEVGRFDVKVGRVGHRTPFQILYDMGQTGDMEDLALWHEFERAIPGTSSIRWSRGLKSRCLIEEETDEELAASELEGVEEETVYFTKAEWDLVCKVPVAQAKVLRAMEAGGSVAVYLVLLNLGADVRGPPLA